MSWDQRPYARDPYEGPRFGDNPMSWSLRLGRVFRIDVRVHFIFLLYIFVELLKNAGPGMVGLGFYAKWLGLLFGIVLLHEFGHCFAARAVGGEADEILMWPLGGLAYVRPPRTAWAHFFTAAGGPLVNVVFCLITAPLLVAGAGTIRAVPFIPFGSDAAWRLASATVWQQWTLILFVINYGLILFNLLPMFPLDGGRLLQAALWPRLGFVRSMRFATSAGMVGAIGLGMLGLLQGNFNYVAIAVFGYVTCLNERRMLAAMGDDAAFGLADDPPRERVPRRAGGLFGWWTRWRQRVRQRQLERQRLERQRLEEEVDRILLKVHEHGLQSLTKHERRTLQEATETRRRGEQVHR
ncbi:MAG: site-2 protease family protein [Phycisphaerae bacterium]